MRPILRGDIQFMATIIEGRRMIAFMDPYDLGESPVAVDYGFLPLLQMLNGRNDLQDIRLELMNRNGGRLVFLSDVEQVIECLDRAVLLDNENFRRRMDAARRDYAALSEREPAHAGKAYPGEPAELIRLIEEEEKELGPAPRPSGTIAGLIAPHIDIRVARKSYVDLYRRLAGQSFDRTVVFGIDHKPQDGLFSVSAKDYLTPCGPLRTDRAFVSELKRELPGDILGRDDFGHKTEHSIEFQALFLRHYLGGDTLLVPILCGGFHEFILGGKDPLADDRFISMLNAVRAAAGRCGGKTLFAAGVDFSHVGQKFGNPYPADVILPRARAYDRDLLACIASGDTAGISRMTLKSRNDFNVCGFPAILFLSALLRDRRAEVLSYETYDERATGSAVGYASIIFYD